MMIGAKQAEKREFLTVQDMALISVMVAFITICAKISIPIGPIPFTLQTFGVFITAGLLGTKRGTMAIVVYILLGFIGLPVFNNSGGPAALTGSTGGYIIGFIFSALVIGAITETVKNKKTTVKIVVSVLAMLVGAIVYFTIGTIQFMAVTGTDLPTSLASCVIPFIVPDLAKMIVATIFIERVKRYSQIFN